MKIQNSKDCFVLLTLISLATLVILWKLGKGSLYDWDEAIYAQISKEIVQRGAWLTPYYNYEPWFEKPPLLMWLTATFFSLFGVSEFWARATSAFSGIGLVIVTYLIAKFIYSKYVGCLAVLILLTSYEFLDRTRFGTTDILLTFFIFLAIYAYLQLSKGNQRWWYLIWISFSLAFMTKGVGAIVIPPVIVLSLWFNGNLIVTFRSHHFWLGFLIAFLVIVPWHIFMVVKYGMEFIDVYLGYHVISRITRTLDKHTGDLFFYVKFLQTSFFPWFYLVPFALALNFKQNFKSRHQSLVLLICLCVVFSLYSLLVQTKLVWYIFPVFPVLAIFTASMIEAGFKERNKFSVTGLIIGVILVAIQLSIKKLLIIVCLGLLTISIYLFFKKKLAFQMLSIIIFATFIFLGIAQVKSLYYKQETPNSQLAYIAGSKYSIHRKPLIILGSYDPELWAPTILFYSNRPVSPIYSLEDLSQNTKDGKIHEIVITRKDMEYLGRSYQFNMISEVKSLVYGNIQKISNL